MEQTLHMIEIAYSKQRQRFEAVTVPKGQYVILKDCGWRWDKEFQIWHTSDPEKARFKMKTIKPYEGAG